MHKCSAETRYLATRIAMELGIVTPRLARARAKAARLRDMAPCTGSMSNLGKPSKAYAALQKHMQERALAS